MAKGVKIKDEKSIDRLRLIFRVVNSGYENVDDAVLTAVGVFKRSYIFQWNSFWIGFGTCLLLEQVINLLANY